MGRNYYNFNWFDDNIMSSIFESASKIVFVLFALTVCVAFILGKLEAKDFMVIATMPFVFYFSNKGESNQPFAGK